MDARRSPNSATSDSPWAAQRYQPLVTVVAAVAAGIVMDRYGGAPLGFRLSAIHESVWLTALLIWWLLATGCLAGWWLAWQRRRDSVAAWLLLAAAAFVGASWHQVRWGYFDRHEAARYAKYELAPACVSCVARESPQREPAPPPTPLRAIPATERSRLTIELTGIRDGTSWRPAAGICELSVDGHLLGVHAGDRLRVFGQLNRLQPPLNPGEFDFAAHARADRQLTRMRSSAPESVALVAGAAKFSPVRLLNAARTAAKRMVQRYVGPDRAGLAGAILLGSREGLTTEETQPYLLTGTIHVLVVSGLNVAILATGLVWLVQLGLLTRRLGLALIILAVVLYAMVAESQPPVVRAAVVAVLMCAAAWIGRRGVAFNSLAAAALVVLVIRPGDLFRPGPQLSFLAVATLIWIGPWSFSLWRPPVDRLDQMLAAVRPWYVRVGEWAGWGTLWLVFTSLIVWLTTLPLVLNQFHVGAPISVPISPVIWLVVFVAMWSGFVMLIVGWLVPPVAALSGALCDWSLFVLERLVGWAEPLPGGHFWSGGPAWWWVVGFYLAIMLIMLRGQALAPPRWQLAAICGWIVIGIVPSLVRPWTRDGFECSFVAVGHGACVVMEAPTGETVLYDAGALGAPEYATQTIASYLWHRGIRRIDGLVVSHADIDHYNAIPGLLERFPVGAVYVSPLMFEENGEPGDGPGVLRNAIRMAGVPIHEVWSGDRLRVGSELILEVLHPPRLGVVGTDNANSVTLAVECGGRRLLLPGDLETPGLEDVMAELPYDCDVLLAPHHGSRRSDPPGFAAWSSPEWVVISGRQGEAIWPVVQTYEQAGANVAQTSDCGTVRFSIRPGEMKMATWLAPRRLGGE